MCWIAGAVAAGGKAEDCSKGQGEVTLVGKARLQADVGGGKTLGEEAAGMIYPFLDHIGVGRKPRGGTKGAQKMKLAQVCDAGELTEGYVLRKMLVEIFQQRLHQTRSAVSRAPGPPPLSAWREIMCTRTE